MSEERLIYKGQDVTVDVTLKIEHVVNIIAEQERLDFDAAYRRFAKTQTYAALQNTNSLMWAESAEYIADRYFEE
jgi:hypothetical protein